VCFHVSFVPDCIKSMPKKRTNTRPWEGEGRRPCRLVGEDGRAFSPTVVEVGAYGTKNRIGTCSLEKVVDVAAMGIVAIHAKHAVRDDPVVHGIGLPPFLMTLAADLVARPPQKRAVR